MAVPALIEAIVGFVALVCVGAALRALGLVRREDAKPLNAVIIYVGLPAFVFQGMHGAQIDLGSFVIAAVAWVVFGATLGLSLLVVRRLKLHPGRAGGFVLAGSLGNTGYIGYPLTQSVLGAAAVPLAVLYDVFGTVLQLVLVGIPVARRFVRVPGDGVPGLAKELATFPALVAAIAALLLSNVAIPIPVSSWLDLIAKMVAPLIMISVGISLRPHAVVHAAPVLGILAAIRLIVGPLLALAGAAAFSLEPALRDVAVLQAGMPSMMLTLAVGQRLGLDDDFIAAAVFVTTAASAITIPVVQVLIG